MFHIWRRLIPLAMLAAIAAAGVALGLTRPWGGDGSGDAPPRDGQPSASVSPQPARQEPSFQFAESPETVARYVLCDISIDVVPGRSLEAFARVGPVPPDGSERAVLVVLVKPRLGGSVTTDFGPEPRYSLSLGVVSDTQRGGIDYATPSGLVIDARTGEVLDHFFGSAADQAFLEDVLATLIVGEPTPAADGVAEFDCP